MTVKLELKPEIEAALAQAHSRGLSLEAYLDEVIQNATSAKRQAGRKSLAQLFAESPLKGLDLSFDRERGRADRSTYDRLSGGYERLSELTRLTSDPQVEEWLNNADDEQLFLSVISLGEILKGITILPESRRRQQLQQWVEETLRPWFDGRILPITAGIAGRWGILGGESQLRGRALTMADGLIAATALEHDLTVVRAMCVTLPTSASASSIPGLPDRCR